MKILHVLLSRLSLPPNKYGGTERVIWALSQAQKARGDDVRFLWKKAKLLPENTSIYDKKAPLSKQIGQWPDIVHFHWPFEGELHKPFICTEHGNAKHARDYPVNTVFLSKKHAENHGGSYFIYNGLDWSQYGQPNLENPQRYHHFLGKAKQTTKNLAGAIEIARTAHTQLHVLGGLRFNISKRNPYVYFNPRVRFHGMVGGKKKLNLIRNSRGMIAPSRWHEPFGLAIIESLYLGAPVLATPFGSLPEIINNEHIGFLSTSYEALANKAASHNTFDRQACHLAAKERFNKETMAKNYEDAYERVINNERLHKTAPRAEQSFVALLPLGSHQQYR